jgi:hypothetical protein
MVELTGPGQLMLQSRSPHAFLAWRIPSIPPDERLNAPALMVGDSAAIPLATPAAPRGMKPIFYTIFRPVCHFNLYNNEVDF